MHDEERMTVESGAALCSIAAAEEFSTNNDEHSTRELGKFPARLSSVSAEILARLLSGEHLTSLGAVACASTTRLASRIHYLKVCGWPIMKIEKAAGCRDGRLAWVAQYYMPGAIITKAKQAGAATWCANVKKARLDLRANAARAKREAHRVNALRKGSAHHQQMALFAEENA